jgi:1-acyl-sn-glycerol-3-phosphate acyltransferase
VSTEARRRNGPVFLTAFNLAFWPYLLGTSAVAFGGLVALRALTAPFDRKKKLAHLFNTYWASHYLADAPRAGITVEGREKIDPNRAYVYVANHQSMVDILACSALHTPFKWVSKVENVYAPFIGWAMPIADYVLLKRGNLPSIKRMVKRCRALLRDGESIFVFPEGTRSPDGELLPFYPGAFRLAVWADAPILPVVLDGTRTVLGKGTVVVDPTPVRVQVLDPIEPREVGGDWKRLRDLVRARMQAAQGR